jgi:hypothetical protein
VAGHPEHDLLGDVLDGAGQVHLPLGERRLRLAWRAAEQLVEGRRGHAQPTDVVEVVEVHPEGAVLLQVEEVLADGLRVAGLAIRREPHDLVLAGVHLESGVVGEGRVEQAERMREAKLGHQLHPVALPDAPGGGGPLAHAVHGEEGCSRERRGEERRGGVRLVVLGKHDGAPVPERPRDQVRHPELLAEPRGNGAHEGREPTRSNGQVGLENAIELEKRLVVEGDAVKGVDAEARLAQTSPDGVFREAVVVLHPAEALLLGGGDDLPIAQQARSGVVVVRRDSENGRQEAAL